MAKTADEMVVEIRKFFQNPEVETRELLKLWNILTGLRGPDAGGVHRGRAEAKDATTTVIRHFVLQVDLDADRGMPVDVAERDTDARAEIRRCMSEDDSTGPHFRDHARRAFSALGLSWDYTNVEPTVEFSPEGNLKRDPNPGGD
jgi:hypothetical protein